MEHVGSFLIVEPHQETADILAVLSRRLRKAKVVNDAASARDVLEGARALTGLILEEDLPDESGSAWLKEVRARKPILPILVLTSNTNPEIINRVHRYRAEFHAKPTRRKDVAGFLTRAVTFERVPDVRVTMIVDQIVQDHSLSPRETDLLAAAVGGVSRKELSDQLGTTENTIKSIVKSALRKLGHSTLEEAAREVLRRALAGSDATSLAEYRGRYTPATVKRPLTIQPPGECDEST